MVSRGRDLYRQLFNRLRSILAARRFPIVFATHALLMAEAGYLAFWLRFDGAVPPAASAAYWQTVMWVLAIRLPVFLSFGLFSGLWRYAGIWDLSRIIVATVVSSVALFLLVYEPLGAAVYPRSIVIIDSLLLIFLVGGVRLLWRMASRGLLPSGQGKRVLIVGAGDAAEMIVREMQNGSIYVPVGLMDDDPNKAGRSIHGVKVLGTLADIPAVVSNSRVSEVLLAIPSAEPLMVRRLVRVLEPFKVPVTTLPSLQELLSDGLEVSKIRPLSIEDLLPRAPVTLDADVAKRLIEGKCVLVTGAGGSIGSELCRQIAAFKPATLVALERYENSLYAVANQLLDAGAGAAVQPIIGDVTDAGRIDELLADYRPHIIFHAAAHKHVPLMEANPCEAIKNNVRGTQVLVEAAKRHGVERFVFISTDKAANPSSVMGASKRAAEIVVQAASESGSTRFAIVRFGNVLGSNGSVIPRMLSQIRAGGPVTVTHPHIRRFFMLIPEAVSLVLQAAVLTEKQDTFVLEMGEQITILDLARNLIRLSGYVPDEEIRIAFIGLRPGEKLSEELVGEGETLEPSGSEKIFRVHPSVESEPVFVQMHQIAELIASAEKGQTTCVIEQLGEVVPTFRRSRSASVPAQSRQPGTVTPLRKIASSAQATTALPQT